LVGQSKLIENKDNLDKTNTSTGNSNVDAEENVGHPTGGSKDQ